MKKLFLFDVDGTLVNSNREVLPSTIEAINKAINVGHEVGIVTGRNFCQLNDILQKIPKIRFVASINGGIVTDTNLQKEYIYAKPLDKILVNYFIEIAKRIKREFQCSNNELFYRVYFGDDPKKDITDPIFFKGGSKNLVYDKWDEVKDRIDNMDIYHMAVKCEPNTLKQELPAVKEKFDHLKIAHIGDASSCYIECDNLGINKAFGIQMIQKLTNIDNRNTYFFGDSGNDISALKYVGNPIVMGNAQNNIKSFAKYIIGSHDTDAISNFIMDILKYENY